MFLTNFCHLLLSPASLSSAAIFTSGALPSFKYSLMSTKNVVKGYEYIISKERTVISKGPEMIISQLASLKGFVWFSIDGSV